MAHTTYQVTLSSDHKRTITVISDDPTELERALEQATAIYRRVFSHSRSKAEHRQDIKQPTPAPEQHTLRSRVGSAVRELLEEAKLELGDMDDLPPMCKVHGVRMVSIDGKYGRFWGCRQRNPDGTYCSYRPSSK